MKLKRKRKSKVNLWFAKAAELRTLKYERYLIDEAWSATAAGEEFFAEWRSERESRERCVRRILEENEPSSKALKDAYPDNAPPAALRWKP